MDAINYGIQLASRWVSVTSTERHNEGFATVQFTYRGSPQVSAITLNNRTMVVFTLTCYVGDVATEIIPAVSRWIAFDGPPAVLGVCHLLTSDDSDDVSLFYQARVPIESFCDIWLDSTLAEHSTVESDASQYFGIF